VLAIDAAPRWGGNLAWAAGHYGTAPVINPLVLRSTDQGITWEQSILPFQGASATSVAINPRNTDSVYVSCNNFIFLTTDKGETWEDVFSSRGINISAVAVDPYYPENVFAGGLFFDDSHQSPNHGVFLHSRNGGKDWDEYEPVTDTLLERIYSITVFRKHDDNNAYVFIITAGTGVWLYKYSTLTGLSADQNVPEQFSLFQNFPNPFNPKTHFRFRIPGGFVSLKIYDLLGKEAAVLVNEEKPAGEYEIEFDTKNFSSGVYYYSLTAGASRQTKKMILIK
jgi:hypothetical protein